MTVERFMKQMAGAGWENGAVLSSASSIRQRTELRLRFEAEQRAMRPMRIADAMACAACLTAAGVLAATLGAAGWIVAAGVVALGAGGAAAVLRAGLT
jgi:hypothetical protein